MKVLPKDIFERKEQILEELSPINQAIEDRIDYIIKTVWKTFGFTLVTWYIDDANEGEVGDIDDLIYESSIELDGIAYDCRDRNHRKVPFDIMINDRRYDLRQELPYEWLFKDFELELIEGKKFLSEREEAVAKNREAKKLEKEKAKKTALESAKSKLSKEELQALGL